MRRLCLPLLCLLTALPLCAATPHVEVAAWNLEWFNQNNRGFPESTHGGPTYGPRGEQGLRTIAYLIGKHGLGVVGLEEIQSQADLDTLLPYLPGYTGKMLPGRSAQHCALVWGPGVTVQWQPSVAALAVTSGQREGLHAYVRCGQFGFDYLVVHLANKDDLLARQVGMLQQWVRGALGQSPLRDSDGDVIIGGDFNLEPRDAPLQALIADPALVWCFAGLSPLPPTRAPSGKTIDHLFMSQPCWQVHRLGEVRVPREDEEMGERYRAFVSDHLPVIQSFRTDCE